MTLFLARLPTGAGKPQIYEVNLPSPMTKGMREQRFYTPRAWAYHSPQGASIGIAALDDTPVKAVKRLTAHKKLDVQRRALTQTAVL